MKKIFCLIIIFAAICNQTMGQGCVALKSSGAVCTKQTDHEEFVKGWQLNTNYRYFKSFRHFREKHEEKNRVAEGSDVRNFSHAIDLAIVRNISSRWSISLNAPIIATRRSSLYEHGGKRHSTFVFGVGDIRIAAYRWMVDPAKKTKLNVQLGFSIKLPTGDYKYQDYYHLNDTTKILDAVDQSIQLGDGGTGLTTELNAFYNISKKVSIYGNFYYLINPREQNGVLTSRGRSLTSQAMKDAKKYGSDVMSVPDQYMIRIGANVTLKKFTLSAGLRNECLPVYDLLGGSNGFRRPGYIISAEPGLSYSFKKFNAYAYVPIALERSRTQSVPDKIRSRLTGTRSVGDAAFADYAINIGFSVKL